VQGWKQLKATAVAAAGTRRTVNSWRNLGIQVIYQDLNRTDIVKQHGRTNGSSTILADLPQEQFLGQVVVWSNDSVYGLYFKSNDGTFFKFAGSPFGTPLELQKPIFGFYGGVKDGALVSLGLYTLVDSGAARGPTARVGGMNGTADSWDDTSSSNGTCLSISWFISVLPHVASRVLSRPQGVTRTRRYSHNNKLWNCLSPLAEHEYDLRQQLSLQR
jgi:hypothetical protein